MTSHARSALAHPLLHTPLALVVILAVGLSIGPSSYYGFLMTVALLYGIAAIGLNVPAGMLGQLSLGQGAAMAVGAYTTAILVVDHGWALLPALVVSFVVGFVVGVLMAMPAARLGLIGLAIVTMGFTLIVSDAVIGKSGLTGGANGKFGIYAPLISGDILDTDSIFIVVTVTCALAYLAHWKIRVSTFGRSCLAVRDEELGAAALGISSYRHIVLGFGIGSGIGAVAGGLYGAVATIVTPELFGINLSVLVLLMVIFGGAGTRFGPVLGAAIIGLLPILLARYPDISVYIYGAILIVSLRVLPRGIFRRSAAPVGAFLKRRRAVEPAPEASAPPAPLSPSPEPAETSASSTPTSTSTPDDDDRDAVVLEVKRVSRSFDGVRAVSDADLTIRRGEIVAIIGSNGSGKTTLLNVVCGYYRAQSGNVILAGHDITATRPRAIARLGVSRTFQVPKVFPSLSIEEHLALARSGATHRRTEQFDKIAYDFLRATGMLNDPRREARTLSHGSLRFLEIAMAVLRAPDVLLLDEPAAGLSADEMARLKDVLEQLAANGIGVALIEHHLDWVRSIADRIIVMQLGEQIWTGHAGDLMSSDIVRDSYLLGAANG